jgi:hypothetical protein
LPVAGLSTLPEWAILIRLGQCLRELDPEDNQLTETEMELILTILRMTFRLVGARFRVRCCEQQPRREEGPMLFDPDLEDIEPPEPELAT